MRRLVLFAAALAAAASLTGCGEVRIKDETLRLGLGEEYKLNVNLPKKEDAVYSSLDPNIASVDNDGNVTAVGGGITVITVDCGESFDCVGVVVGNGVASYVDENGNVVSSLTSSDIDEATLSGESDITAISLSIVGGGSGDVTISTDRDYELSIKKTPADSADKVTLRVADGSVARIDGTSLIGVSRGKTTLTATAPNGVSAEMIIRVK